MIKIELLHVDLGPIPGNIYDQGTHIKGELKIARSGFATVSNIQAPAFSGSSSVISTEWNRKNSHIENDDLSKKTHETGKSQGLRNTEDI